MSYQTWQQTLITAEGDGTAYNTSTTATSILPTAAVYTLPSNFCDIGKKFRVTASGRISTTGAPTIIFDVRLAGATCMASQAITCGSGITNLTWELKIDFTVRAIGSGTSANAMFTGYALGVGGSGTFVSIPVSAPVVSAGFNSTSANTVDLFATWGTNSASNTITLHQYSLESLN